MEDQKTFNAKILLFGEYTVTTGSSALALPFSRFFGLWSHHDQDHKAEPGLLKLYDYLSKIELGDRRIKLSDFKFEIEQGLFFKSNIPEGYGLGSSGALSAAFYDRFVIDKNEDLELIKNDLILIENGFHGSSSGIDPLVSFLDKTILINSGGDISTCENFNISNNFFLIDTGISRETAPLVSVFKEKLVNDLKFCEGIQLLKVVNNNAINSFLGEDMDSLYTSFSEISQLQFDLFKPMILEQFKLMWKEGLDSDYFKLKLCGAGAGGMILGYTNDKERLMKNYEKLNITFF